AAPGGAATPPQAARSSAPVRPLPSTGGTPAPAADETGNAVAGTSPLLALPDPVEAAPAPPASGTSSDAARLEPRGLLPAPAPPPVGAPGASAGRRPGVLGPGGTRPALNPEMLPPPAMEAPVISALPGPVQAPQRRGPISSLFNGMASWLRR